MSEFGAPSTSAPVVVGVTGASGVTYARRLVRFLLERRIPVHLIVSGPARLVIREELPPDGDTDPWGTTHRDLLQLHAEKDFSAPFCSGTYPVRGMVVVPATMGSIGSIASGISENAIHRGADVALKEGRRLVVVPRETPLSVIHLRNLLALAEAGAIVLPPSPAFYQGPRTLEDIVDFVVSRVLDALGVPNRLIRRWGSTDGEGSNADGGSTSSREAP